MSHWTATLFAKAFEALKNNKKTGQSSVGVVIDSIWKQPIKLLAAFLVAPFLVFRVAERMLKIQFGVMWLVLGYLFQF